MRDWRADYRKKELALRQSEGQVTQLQAELGEYKVDLCSAEFEIEQEKRKGRKENKAIKESYEESLRQARNDWEVGVSPLSFPTTDAN